jgi:hypothetical protein
LLKFKKFTFLRDPVQRVFSEYRYQQPETDFYEFYKEISNLQVRYFSGLSSNDPTISLSEHLASAKRVLSEKFFFVGIVEDMDRSIQTLYKLLQWEPPACVPALNTTSQNEFPNPDLVSFVSREEWADKELYEYATLLLQQHVQKAALKN